MIVLGVHILAGAFVLLVVLSPLLACVVIMAIGSLRGTCSECGRRLFDRRGRHGKIIHCPGCGCRRRLTLRSGRSGRSGYAGPPRPIPNPPPRPRHVNGIDRGYQPSGDFEDVPPRDPRRVKMPNLATGVRAPVDLSRVRIPSGDTAIAPPT